MKHQEENIDGVTHTLQELQAHTSWSLDISGTYIDIYRFTGRYQILSHLKSEEVDKSPRQFSGKSREQRRDVFTLRLSSQRAPYGLPEGIR